LIDDRSTNLLFGVFTRADAEYRAIPGIVARNLLSIPLVLSLFFIRDGLCRRQRLRRRGHAALLTINHYAKLLSDLRRFATAKNFAASLEIAIVVGSLVFTARYLTNYCMLQRPLDRITQRDAGNSCVRAEVYYGSFLDFGDVVFNFQDMSPLCAAADSLRVFAQFGREMRGRHFRRVTAAYRRQRLFEIRGDEFADLDNPQHLNRQRELLAALDRWVGLSAGGAIADEALYLRANRVVREWAAPAARTCSL
jgi:hypothetical protein